MSRTTTYLALLAFIVITMIGCENGCNDEPGEEPGEEPGGLVVECPQLNDAVIELVDGSRPPQCTPPCSLSFDKVVPDGGTIKSTVLTPGEASDFSCEACQEGEAPDPGDGDPGDGDPGYPNKQAVDTSFLYRGHYVEVIVDGNKKYTGPNMVAGMHDILHEESADQEHILFTLVRRPCGTTIREIVKSPEYNDVIHYIPNAPTQDPKKPFITLGRFEAIPDISGPDLKVPVEFVVINPEGVRVEVEAVLTCMPIGESVVLPVPDWTPCHRYVLTGLTPGTYRLRLRLKNVNETDYAMYPNSELMWQTEEIQFNII